MYKTIFRPTLLYSSETRTLTKVEQNKIKIWERNTLRKICGGNKVEDEWER